MANTQGAPTEGLGQNVTFAFQPGTGLPQMPTIQAPQQRAGVIGGPAAGGPKQIAPPPPNPYTTQTLDFLVQIGGAVLKPRIEQAKMERFVSGMQEAATGAAMADIVEQQPWYSRIFGESDTVEGARAWHSEASVNNAIADLDSRMGDLRKLDPQGARQAFMEAIQSGMTGDKATDGAVLQSMMRNLPTFMKAQAKEHYAWRQEEAVKAEDESWNAWDRKLRTMDAKVLDGTMSEDDRMAEIRNFQASLVPPPGRDFESWQKANFERIARSIDGGNLGILDILDTPLTEGEPTFLSTLSASQRNQLQERRASAERRLLADAPMDLLLQAEEIDVMVRSRQISPNEALARYAAVNAQYKARTGNRLELVNTKTQVSSAGAGLKANFDEQERRRVQAENSALRLREAAMTEAAKEQAKLQVQYGITAALANGGLFPPGTTGAQKEQAWALVRGMDPEKQALVRRNAYTSDARQIDEAHAQAMQAPLRAIRAQPLNEQTLGHLADQLQIIDQFRRTAAPGMVDAYLGKEADILRLLDQLGPEGVHNPQFAVLAGAHLNRPQLPPGVSAASAPKAVKEGALDFVKSRSAGYLDNLLTFGKDQDRLDAAQLDEWQSEQYGDKLARLAAPLIAAGRRPVEAYAAADGEFRRRGGDIIGGFVLEAPAGATPLREYLVSGDPTLRGLEGAINSYDVDLVVRDGINMLSERHRLDPNTLSVTQSVDVDGVPSLVLNGMTVDGQQRTVAISAAAIKEIPDLLEDTQRERVRAAREAGAARRAQQRQDFQDRTIIRILK